MTEEERAALLIRLAQEGAAAARAELEREERQRREAQEAITAYFSHPETSEDKARRLLWEQNETCKHLRDDIPFLPTSVAALVLSTIERCFRFGQNGLILGASGVGKSKALEEAVRRANDLEGPDAVMIEISPTSGASVMAVFEDLCPHLGVYPAHSIADTERRLKKKARFHPIVLVDEAQNLTLKAARTLTIIGEACRFPIVFCGNREVLRLVNTAQADIQQLGRRIPVREEVTCITDDDADLIASHFGVEDMDTYELCS